MAHAEGPGLVYLLRSETDRQVILIDTQVDLSVLVRDTLGRLVPGAQLRLRGHSVPYDAIMGAFRRTGSSRLGLRDLTVGRRTTYHAPIRPAPAHSYIHIWNRAHELGHRLMYGWPVGYVSLPVPGPTMPRCPSAWPKP
ncbi:hypothetical protein GCM10022409_37910 [Hymenobacter glaciei]|uniref:Uncharacterized protein n=1 Tax=Hymenobacter glaciei TaxID=877209 RepID=A0ABP7UNU6_9BACT